MAKSCGKLVLLVGILGAVAVDGCFKKFTNEPEFEKAMAACMQKLTLTADTMPKMEDHMNSDYDDKCYGKCILEAMDLLTEAKALDRDAVFDMIEENAPKPLVNKLTEAVTKCSDTSAVVKITNPADCKPYALFYGCMITSADKLC